MTYKELKDGIANLSAVYGINFTAVNDGKRVAIKNNDVVFAKISNNIPYYMELNHEMFLCLDDNLRHDLLSIIYEFAQTPIYSRNLFSKYNISSKLTPCDYGRFLFKINGNINALAWGERCDIDAEFTQEEIDYICDKFHTDLKDFNIDEVKE